MLEDLPVERLRMYRLLARPALQERGRIQR